MIRINGGTLGKFAQSIICGVLGIWMLTFWVVTGKDLKRQYLGYPVQDYWRSVVNLPRYETFDLSVLWEQHNEHRVIVPEIIYMMDDRILGAHEFLPLILSSLFQAVTFAILAWAVWRDRAPSPALRLAAIFTGGLVLGWPGISYVLSFAFLIQWTVVQALAAAALLMLTREQTGAAIGCAILATFSAGHGMLLWPVLLLAGLILGFRWARLAVIALAGTLSISAYFYRLVPSLDSQAHRFLHEPAWFFGFLASMLSMPFGADRRILGLWLGPLSAILFGVVLLLAWRRKLLREPQAILLFGLSIFSLMTVVLCGVGRTLPTYWEYPTAKVARYLSVPVCWWAALLMATVWVLARLRHGTAISWAAIVVMGAGMAYQFPRLNPWLTRQFDFYSRAQSVTVAMESGAMCDNLIGADLYPDPEDIHQWDPILKQRRLSVYSDDRFRWIGRPLASLMQVRPAAAIRGGVTETLSFPCAKQLAGWMDGDERELVLVNEKGIIAGLGRRLPAGLPLYLPRVWAQALPAENWTGFVNHAIASVTVQPFAVLEDGRSVAPLGDPIGVGS